MQQLIFSKGAQSPTQPLVGMVDPPPHGLQPLSLPTVHPTF